MRKPSVEETLACQISSWYPHFRSCFRHEDKNANAFVENLMSNDYDDDDDVSSNITRAAIRNQTKNRHHATIRSISIPLPQTFIDYLLSDGVVLPEGSNVSSCAATNMKNEDDDEDDDKNEEESNELITEKDQQQDDGDGEGCNTTTETLSLEKNCSINSTDCDDKKDSKTGTTASNATDDNCVGDNGIEDEANSSCEGKNPAKVEEHEKSTTNTNSSNCSYTTTSSTSSSENEPIAYSFLELNASIEQAIKKLGGAVVPKLNWSCPKDATWVNEGTLKCRTAGDVYVLLKSSDFIMHDILYPFDHPNDEDKGLSKQHQQREEICHEDTNANDKKRNNDDDLSNSTKRATSDQDGLTTEGGGTDNHHSIPYTLSLRKWCHLYKSMEYRCFVSGGSNETLLAICQRDHTQFYPYLRMEQERIQSNIIAFFEHVIQSRFCPVGSSVKDGIGDGSNNDHRETVCKAATKQKFPYVFDCYVDQQSKVWLIDFNVWGTQTDSLLFDWKELENLRQRVELNDSSKQPMIEEHEQIGHSSVKDDSTSIPLVSEALDCLPKFLLVENEMEVHHDPLASYRAPIDTVDLATGAAAAAADGSDSSHPFGMSSFQEFMNMCSKPSSS